MKEKTKKWVKRLFIWILLTIVLPFPANLVVFESGILYVVLILVKEFFK